MKPQSDESSGQGQDVARALDALRRGNEARGHDQAPASPVPVGEVVPTIDGVGMPMSPMLRARFSYCAQWCSGYMYYDWLSWDEMAALPKRPAVQKRIATRLEFWTGSKLGACSGVPGGVALFAIDWDEHGEIYLVRDSVAQHEPSVVVYCGQSECVYRSLLEFLHFAVS